MSVFCHYQLDIPHYWLRMTNQEYFSAWKTLLWFFTLPLLMICTNSCCWSWSVTLLWICLTEMIYLACHWLSIAGIFSWNLDLPWSECCLTDLLCCSTWNSLQKIFIVPAIISWWISEVERWSLASQKPSIASFYVDFLNAPCGRVRISNLLYFDTWNALRKTFMVLLLIMSTCNCFSNWFSWNVICAYYLIVPYRWPSINKWIYFVAWKRSWKICFVPVLVICVYSCCWRFSIVSSSTCATKMCYLRCTNSLIRYLLWKVSLGSSIHFPIMMYTTTRQLNCGRWLFSSLAHNLRWETCGVKAPSVGVLLSASHA